MSKPRRRRREEQRRLVEQWNDSGESAVAFAARIGVGSNTLYRWRAALAGAAAKDDASTLSRIVEVRAATSAATSFEVEAAGRRVRVPREFDEASLKRLLRVLETTP